jgi:hypothetical protein
MPVPLQENIQQSLSRLKQSLPLFHQDIGNIAWAFAFLPNQDQLFLHYIINTAWKMP